MQDMALSIWQPWRHIIVTLGLALRTMLVLLPEHFTGPVYAQVPQVMTPAQRQALASELGNYFEHPSFSHKTNMAHRSPEERATWVPVLIQEYLNAYEQALPEQEYLKAFNPSLAQYETEQLAHFVAMSRVEALYHTIYPRWFSPSPRAREELQLLEKVPLHSKPKGNRTKGYDSWSLFLLCNPSWLGQEYQEKLWNLYTQFQAFSRVIGPSHLAIWFWARPFQEKTRALSQFVDVSRSSEYCAKLKLLPSKGPHILVTTSYPDLSKPIIGDKVVLELNSLPSTEIGILLTKLADQLLVQGLQQEALDSEAYWRGWQRSFEKIYDAAVGALKQVKITIDAKFVKAEIGGKSD
jgi:hypothetical protein